MVWIEKGSELTFQLYCTRLYGHAVQLPRIASVQPLVTAAAATARSVDIDFNLFCFVTAFTECLNKLW